LQIQNSKAKIYYNFCDNTLFSCNGKSSLMAADYGSSKCDRLAGSAQNVNKWTLEKAGTDDNVKKIVISLNQGDMCRADPTKNYTVTMSLTCDPNGEKKAITWDPKLVASFDPEKCDNTLSATTVEACPQIDFYVLATFMEQYKWLIGSVMILIGLFELFFGVKLVTFTTFIISTIAVVSVVFIFFFQFIIPKGSNPNIVWVVLGISSVLGLVLGYFLSKMYKVFIGLFGGFIGYLLGTLLYTFALSRIDWNPTALYWIIVCTLILVGLLLSYFLSDFIMITCTSFIGGYLLVRGISLFAGGFPDEQLIQDYMSKGEYDQLNKMLNWAAYLYFSAWIVLWIIGIIVQSKLNKEKKKDVDEDKINNTNFYFKMDK